MALILLFACHPTTVGMRIEATVTSDVDVSNTMAPCRCNAHRFDEQEARVGVARSALQDGVPDLVFSVDYASDLDLCGRDGVVRHEPVEVSSVEGDVLYTVDAWGALQPVDDAPVVATGADALAFVYEVDGGEVREEHAVVFRDTMIVDGYAGAPCCGPGADMIPAGAVLAMFLAMRRGHPPITERA